MHDFENNPEEDDFELEISDIPGERHVRNSHARLLALWSEPARRMRLWRFATVASAIILIVLVISGSFPALRDDVLGLFARPAPASTSSSLAGIPEENVIENHAVFWRASIPPQVSPNAILEPAPRNCSEVTPTREFASPTFPPGVGSFPMWVIGFKGPLATLDHFTRARQSELGWMQPITLVFETTYHGGMRIDAGSLDQSFPLWLGRSFPHRRLTTVIMLQSQDARYFHRVDPGGQWESLTIDLYIPFAGCYYLRASSYQGSWTAFFAAGK